MTAPGCEELDKVIAAGHVLGKGVLGEVHHLAKIGVLDVLALGLTQIRLGGRAQFQTGDNIFLLSNNANK